MNGRAPIFGILVALLAGCGDASSPAPAPTPAPTSTGANAEPGAAAPAGVLSADGTWRVRWSSDPAAIPLDELFDVEVRIEAAADDAGPLDDVGFSIDARMPHHRHGMLVAPEIVRLGPGHFRAGGLMLHMPGYWELHLDVIDGGAVERAQVAMEIDG